MVNIFNKQHPLLSKERKKVIKLVKKIRKVYLKNAKIGILLTGAAIASFNNKCLGFEYKTGNLLITNTVNDSAFDKISYNIRHVAGAKEWYESPPDSGYNQVWWLFTKTTKIVSIVQDYGLINHELINDVRPLDSFTSVNLELSLHEINGDPIAVSNLENWLRCQIDPQSKDSDFGKEPITLWERKFPGDFNLDGKVRLDDFAYFAQDWNATDVNSIADISGPNGIPDRNVNFYDLEAFGDDYLKDPNDPNNYTISLLADIREACAKQGGVGIIPLPTLNGTYESQKPYDRLRLRFDVYPGDFDLHSRVDMQDFASLAEDWGKTDVNSIVDISGPLGIPDKKVDFYDLNLFTRDYLKDANDPNTW